MERYFGEKGFRTFTIRGEWEDLNSIWTKDVR